MMIGHVAVALVLVASSALGNTTPSCPDLQHNMLLRTGLTAGDIKTMETSGFENTVALQRSGDSTLSMIIKHAYVVQPGQEGSLPTVTVNGFSYQVYSIEVIPLNALEGTAALEIVFTYDKLDDEARDISFFVPIITVDNDASGVSKGLRSTLENLNSVPNEGAQKISFEWLKPLLEKVMSAKLSGEVQSSTMENVNIYLTICQNVSLDYIHPFFL